MSHDFRIGTGVDLVPANIELSGLEVTLVNIMSRETGLRQYLSTLAPAYDYAIIDCMPSLGMLTINALTAADSVIIPVQGQYLAAKGLEQLDIFDQFDPLTLGLIALVVAGGVGAIGWRLLRKRAKRRAPILDVPGL